MAKKARRKKAVQAAESMIDPAAWVQHYIPIIHLKASDTLDGSPVPYERELALEVLSVCREIRALQESDQLDDRSLYLGVRLASFETAMTHFRDIVRAQDSRNEFFRGHWIEVAEREGAILRSLGEYVVVDRADVFLAAWGSHFLPRRDSDVFKNAIRRLNRKLLPTGWRLSQNKSGQVLVKSIAK